MSTVINNDHLHSPVITTVIIEWKYIKLVQMTYLSMVLGIAWRNAKDSGRLGVVSKMIERETDGMGTDTLSNILVHIVQLCHTWYSIILQYHKKKMSNKTKINRKMNKIYKAESVWKQELNEQCQTCNQVGELEFKF